MLHYCGLLLGPVATKWRCLGILCAIVYWKYSELPLTRSFYNLVLHKLDTNLVNIAI